MSLPQQPGALQPVSDVTTATAAFNENLQKILEAIRSDDGQGIVDAFNRAIAVSGNEWIPILSAEINTNGLTERMLVALTKRAENLQTSSAWCEAADLALIMGDDKRGRDGAERALQLDPTYSYAAIIASTVANRMGEYDRAFQVASDLVTRVPAEKNNPLLVIQTAIAEVNRGQPKAALAVIDAAESYLTGGDVEYSAQVLRARAFSGIPERSADAVTAWERAVAMAPNPSEVDQARDYLVAALARAHRYDDAVKQLDTGIAATTNETTRSNWLQARVNTFVVSGKNDEALAALDDLLATTTVPDLRLNFRLQQAHIAARASKWEDAAKHFDAALTEVPADATTASETRRGIQMQKAQTLAPNKVDLVLKDLDELDSTWDQPGWPIPIDLRITGLNAAGKFSEALEWLEARLARTPDIANHPAAHQIRAETLLKLGRTDDAMEECRRAVALAATTNDARGFAAILISAFGSQQWKAAVDAYEKLAQVDQASASDPTVRVIAAFNYLRIGDQQTALSLTDDAQPLNLVSIVMRGACRAEAQVRLGMYDEALVTTAETLERYESGKSAASPNQVPPEYVLLLHTLRAQAFNEKGQFEEARRAASAAIDAPDQPGVVLAGLPGFLRIGALMQRTLALYRQKNTAGAHKDINQAIKEFERLRDSAIMRVLQQSPEFERFEGALWYAKGSVLESENRNEEALAAYTRSAQFEQHSGAAAIARGNALSRTGAFLEALTAFDIALTRASSPLERANAFAGKGRALERLEKYEEAIGALQSALDARLTEQDDDPGVFEQLGIAYDSLQRNEAAKRAFERAWELTPENNRSHNLARGITKAELRLGNPRAVLNFLDALPPEFVNESTLQFNRALALNAIGQRRAAIRCLVAAKELGLARAQAELDRLDAPAGIGRWTHYWFGSQTRPARLVCGIVLVIIAGTGLAAPVFQWWLNDKFDWYLLLLPSIIALVFLALPNLKSIGFEGAGVTLSVEPLPATGRDAAAVAAPEGWKTGELTVAAPILFAKGGESGLLAFDR